MLKIHFSSFLIKFCFFQTLGTNPFVPFGSHPSAYTTGPSPFNNYFYTPPTYYQPIVDPTALNYPTGVSTSLPNDTTAPTYTNLQGATTYNPYFFPGHC